MLGEEVATIEALDRFNSLGELGRLPSADEWLELRRLRKEIPHDQHRPQEHTVRSEDTRHAVRRLLELFVKVTARFERVDTD